MLFEAQEDWQRVVSFLSLGQKLESANGRERGKMGLEEMGGRKKGEGMVLRREGDRDGAGHAVVLVVDEEEIVVEERMVVEEDNTEEELFVNRRR